MLLEQVLQSDALQEVADQRRGADFERFQVQAVGKSHEILAVQGRGRVRGRRKGTAVTGRGPKNLGRAGVRSGQPGQDFFTAAQVMDKRKEEQ